MKVRYTGQHNVREIDAAAFRALENLDGVSKVGKSVKKVTWNGPNDVQELDKKTAEALVKTHGSEFELVEDEEVDEDDENLDDEDDSSDDDDEPADDESPELGEGSPADRGTPAP